MRHITHHPEAVPTVVKTSTYHKIADLIGVVHRYTDVGAITGPSGIGKSFLTERLAQETGCETVYVSLPGKPARREALVAILKEITGKFHNSEGVVLRGELEDLLAERPRIIIVDEVHRVDDVVLDQLSHLHSHEDAKWTLILVGAPKLADKLKRYEHLRSRCDRILSLPRLEGDELVSAVRQLHPWFAHAPQELLLEIDVQHAHGSFREWVRFLRTVADIKQETRETSSTLTRDLAAAAASRRIYGGQPPS